MCDLFTNEDVGFMIDNNTREILNIAPLFDNGMSLHWNMIPNFDTYSSEITNIGTFDVKNSMIAKEKIKNNPKKYKSWAKELRLHIDDIKKEVEYQT